MIRVPSNELLQPDRALAEYKVHLSQWQATCLWQGICSEPSTLDDRQTQLDPTALTQGSWAESLQCLVAEKTWSDFARTVGHARLKTRGIIMPGALLTFLPTFVVVIE